MAIVGYAVGFADFTSSLTISQIAELFSSRVFGGIAFVEKDVEEDYEAGILCLAQDFLGLQVDLFGGTGRYTVEIGTRPSASVPMIDEVCDLSAMLKHSIEALAVSEIQLS